MPPYESPFADVLASVEFGTLKHRNYRCRALANDRQTHAPQGLAYKALLDNASNLAMERALLPDIRSRVPPPLDHPTFHWHIEPSGGTFRGRFYTYG